MVDNPYDMEYFEDGIQKHISNYEKYRWMPEKTIPIVKAYINWLKMNTGDTVLDFGAAKGYTVRAFRELGFNAWGCDISSYAVNNCDPKVKHFMRLCTNRKPVPFGDVKFDFIIAKDVLEHIPSTFLSLTLQSLFSVSTRKTKLFVMVPLAKYSGGPYLLDLSENDATHVIREDLEGWKRLLGHKIWNVEDASYCVPGICDKYSKAKCVGFMTLVRK